MTDKREELPAWVRERIAEVVDDELEKALARRGLTWDQAKDPWLRTPPVSPDEFRREIRARVNLAFLGGRPTLRPHETEPE
jgi:hypothetical protein